MGTILLGAEPIPIPTFPLKGKVRNALCEVTNYWSILMPEVLMTLPHLAVSSRM
jgi:hypothetical protein